MIHSLEQQRLQLKTAMDERLHEIEVHKLVLKAQLKAADEERNSVNKVTPCAELCCCDSCFFQSCESVQAASNCSRRSMKCCVM